MSALKYTIVINDQRFTLLRDQIICDAPNYFTAFFEGPFQETSEGVREMTLYRDPYLFKFVHMYLSGYEILLQATTSPVTSRKRAGSKICS